MRLLQTNIAIIVFTIPFAGCGGGAESQQAQDAAAQNTADADHPHPSTRTKRSHIAAIEVAPQTTPVSEPPAAELSPAAQILKQIHELRAHVVPAGQDLDELRARRRERNDKIIELATEAIALCHEDESQVDSFNEAVQQLLEARLQIALLGAADDIDALYSDAASLKQRDRESLAAAEAAYVLARFAHTNARRYGRQNPEWLTAFSRQARLYAEGWPEHTARATLLLAAAGRSCDLHGINEETINCYALLKRLFPDTPQAQRAAGALRRLQLVGNRLSQFEGPTLEGDYISLDSLADNVVVILFWSSENRQFVEMLPALSSIEARYRRHGLRFIGVNLNEEELDIDAFLEHNSLPGRHIFFPDSDRRRWNSPLVNYYGVRDIPLLWLVDRKGIVRSTRVNMDELEEQIQQLLSARD